MLKQTFEPLRIPVLAGWRSGHCDPNLTLPMGALVRLDAGSKELVLEQDVVVRRPRNLSPGSPVIAGEPAPAANVSQDRRTTQTL